MTNAASPASVSGSGGALTPRPAAAASQISEDAKRFESAKLASAQREVKNMVLLDSLSKADGRKDQGVTQAGGHAFRLRNDRWVDTKLTDGMRVVQVQAYSKSYFAMLEKIPELRSLFAVGDRVVVVGRGVAIEVVAQARELSGDELGRVVKDW